MTSACPTNSSKVGGITVVARASLRTAATKTKARKRSVFITGKACLLLRFRRTLNNHPSHEEFHGLLALRIDVVDLDQTDALRVVRAAHGGRVIAGAEIRNDRALELIAG